MPSHHLYACAFLACTAVQFTSTIKNMLNINQILKMIEILLKNTCSYDCNSTFLSYKYRRWADYKSLVRLSENNFFINIINTLLHFSIDKKHNDGQTFEL